MRPIKILISRTFHLAFVAIYLFSCAAGSQAQEQTPAPPARDEATELAVADDAALRDDRLQQDNLGERHPDAGIWVSYKNDNDVQDLKAPYIKGVMAYARWRDLYVGEHTFDWGSLNRDLEVIINEAHKKAFVAVAAGYCPELDWPEPAKQRIAARKRQNQKGCSPLQFWDPAYMALQEEYIRALASYLAAFDANDRNPRQTDILFVRAQVMAETMENLPSDYTNWEWQDFNAAPNGRIYQVDLTEEIVHDYQRDIALMYKRELEQAYRARGLAVAPVSVIKGADYWEAEPNRDLFVQEGLWLDKHNGAPNPVGWYFDFIQKARTGETRATMESGQHWPADYLGQFTYWEVLSALHSGVEFISLYGNNRNVPRLQPKGPVSFLENREIVVFGTHYAGTARNPSTAPGAWIALRGNYPQDYWTELHHVRIWTNLEHLLTQYRPQDSVLLVGVDAEESAFQEVIPRVRRKDEMPWSQEISVCQATYPAYECEFLHQKPQRYLGEIGGRHTYTYEQSDLGSVLYCGPEMFCERRGAATREEPMLWARRTDGATGSPYMRFNLNDQFAQNLGRKARVRIVYLDQGNDSWSLEYDSQSGPNKTAAVVQKSNSNLWREFIVDLDDLKLNNRQEGGTDFALYNMGDGDDIFHMIEIMRPAVDHSGQDSDDDDTLPTATPPTATPPAATPPAATPPTATPPTATPPAPTAPVPPLAVHVFQEQEGEVVMEAESFSKSWAGQQEAAEQTWTHSLDFNGSDGGVALRALPDRDVFTDERLIGPMLAFRINFEHPGQYQVSVRGMGPDYSSNSIHVGLNGERVTSDTGLSWPAGEQKFTWRRAYRDAEEGQPGPVVVDVTKAGVHTLNIWMREDGVVVDKIWLTRIAELENAPEDEQRPDPEATPTPEPEAEVPIQSPVSDGSPELGPVESPVEMAPLMQVQLPLVMKN